MVYLVGVLACWVCCLINLVLGFDLLTCFVVWL